MPDKFFHYRGAFDEKDGLHARGQHRADFFHAIELDAPTVLEELADRPFKLFQAIPHGKRIETVEAGWIRWERWSHIGSGAPLSPQEETFKLALWAFAQQFNLTDDWCLDSFVFTLSSWEEGYPQPGHEDDPPSDAPWPPGTYARAIAFHQNHPFPFSRDELRFRHESDGWLLHAQTEGEFRQEATREWKETLDNYVAWVKRTAAERGLESLPERHSSDYLRWLVRYQVLGRSTWELAEESLRSETMAGGETFEREAKDGDESSEAYDRWGDRYPNKEKRIWAGIKNAADRVGLTLRDKS